jgi:hypothetical protein
MCRRSHLYSAREPPSLPPEPLDPIRTRQGTLPALTSVTIIDKLTLNDRRPPHLVPRRNRCITRQRR